jgi:hypothetical protein
LERRGFKRRFGNRIIRSVNAVIERKAWHSSNQTLPSPTPVAAQVLVAHDFGQRPDAKVPVVVYLAGAVGTVLTVPVLVRF